MTVMEFTKMLVGEGGIAIVKNRVNVFLHARGREFPGYHANRQFSFEVNFSSSATATQTPPFFPTMDPSKSPIASSKKSPSEKLTPAPSITNHFGCDHQSVKEYYYGKSFFNATNHCKSV